MFAPPSTCLWHQNVETPPSAGEKAAFLLRVVNGR